MYRVGILGENPSDPAEARLWQAFQLGLQERGWIEGGNILFEHRWVEGNSARLPDLAADLIRLKPDLITTRGAQFTQALKEVTASIPIIFVVHADPVGTGHVASLARPGGNITGLALLQTVLGPKSLEVLHAAAPTAGRIAVLWHPDTPTHSLGLQALEEPAQRLQLQLQPVGVRTAADFEGAFSSMSQGGTRAVLVLSAPLFRIRATALGRVGASPSAPDDVRAAGAC